MSVPFQILAKTLPLEIEYNIWSAFAISLATPLAIPIPIWLWYEISKAIAFEYWIDSAIEYTSVNAIYYYPAIVNDCTFAMVLAMTLVVEMTRL
jgi:hypothetical protein